MSWRSYFRAGWARASARLGEANLRRRTAASDAIEQDNQQSDISLELLNDSAANVHCLVDDSLQWAADFVPNNASTTNSHALVLDYSGAFPGAWWPFSNQPFAASAFAIDAYNRKRMIVLGYNGRAYYWNTEKNDDGTTISTEWQSQKLFGSGQNLKVGRSVKLYPGRRGNVNLSFQYRTDLRTTWSAARDVKLYSGGDSFLGSTFVLGTSKLGSSNEPITSLDLETTFTHIEFRLTDSITLDPWWFNKMEFLGFGVGTARGINESNIP